MQLWSWLGKSEICRAGQQEGKPGKFWSGADAAIPQVEFLFPQRNCRFTLKAFQLIG